MNQRGGVAIVRDPNDAIYKDMPSRALEYAEPHYILPARDIAPILVEAANAKETELAMAKKNAVSRKSVGRNDKRKVSSSSGLEKPGVNEDVAYSVIRFAYPQPPTVLCRPALPCHKLGERPCSCAFSGLGHPFGGRSRRRSAPSADRVEKLRAGSIHSFARNQQFIHRRLGCGMSPHSLFPLKPRV